MAQTKRLNARVMQAIHTESEWQNSNPILLKGEIGYVSDKPGMYKVGDGVSTWNNLLFADVPTHSHNYAGSSNPGGSANSALKLQNDSGTNYSVGSGTKPIYFEGGVPKEGSYTLNKSVPSTATFTDVSVTQTAITSGNKSNFTTYRPLIIGSAPKSSNSDTGSISDTTGGVYAAYNIYADLANGVLFASTFKGKLEGTASKAETLVDGSGNAYSLGSSTKGVYFENGVPKAMSYEVNKTVPSNAVFTDTTYSSKAAANGGTDVSLVTTGDKYKWNKAVDDIANLPDPMVFKGSLGTGGTITSLPTASSSNRGYTYKVIVNGTYASQSAKAGDMFTSDGSSWVLIPSGDEPSGTVTNVATGAGLTGGPITSTGTLKANMVQDTNSTYGSNSVTNTNGRQYAVVPDANGKLSVNVPWTDANNAVLQEYLSSGNISGKTANRPLLIAYSANSSNYTGSVYAAYNIYANIASGALYASTFNGTLKGNADTATKLQTARNVFGFDFDGSKDIKNYGICNTSSSDAAKTVVIDGWKETDGAIIFVKFANQITNSSTSLTLRVDPSSSTTGTVRNVYMYGTVPLNSSYLGQTISAGTVLAFVWDSNSNYFRLLANPWSWRALYASNANLASYANYLNTSRYIDGVSFNGGSNIIHFATCTTAAATAAKTASITNFSYVTGAKFALRFSNGITFSSTACTLSMNSGTAYTIKYDGQDTTALDGTSLPANSVLEFICDTSNACFWVVSTLGGMPLIDGGTF